MTKYVLTIRVTFPEKETAPAKHEAGTEAEINTTTILPDIRPAIGRRVVCGQARTERSKILDILLSKGELFRDYAINQLQVRGKLITKRIRELVPILEMLGFRIERLAKWTRHECWRLRHIAKGAA